VTVNDRDSDELTVHFYDATDDSLLGSVYHIPSGEYTNFLYNYPFETTVLWYAVASDGKLSNRSDIWIFTTRLIPPTNKKPVADPGGPYYGGIGEDIVFDGSESNDSDGVINFYRWNFGDGSSEILDTAPSHVYSDPGTYTITLTVVDNDGRSSSAETTAMILTEPLSNYPPFADVGGPYTGEVGSSVSFNGSGSSDSDGNIMVYNWSFGDGIYKMGEIVGYKYSSAGTYLVELTVTDDDGATHSATTTVKVKEASGGIPGFEVIFVVGALFVVMMLRRRKRINSQLSS
jgi:chitodextrinase